MEYQQDGSEDIDRSENQQGSKAIDRSPPLSRFQFFLNILIANKSFHSTLYRVAQMQGPST